MFHTQFQKDMLYSETKSSRLRSFQKDELVVKISHTRKEMGEVAAQDVSAKINELLEKKPEINMIFAAAPSQSDFFKILINDPSIDWKRINAFHMDEYIGLEKDAPQGFGNLLKRELFDHAPFKNVYYINGSASDQDAECKRYADLLDEYPVDIVCLGIGENGHIAFNDPPVADFNDEKLVKVVELEESCRVQQVNDKCFTEINLVPTKAYTLTIPALLRGDYMYCIVPTKLKAEAVRNTLYDAVTEKCPATILRTKQNAYLYLDEDSASLLNK